jgi:hypothetical protein
MVKTTVISMDKIWGPRRMPQVGRQWGSCISKTQGKGVRRCRDHDTRNKTTAEVVPGQLNKYTAKASTETTGLGNQGEREGIGERLVVQSRTADDLNQEDVERKAD